MALQHKDIAEMGWDAFAEKLHPTTHSTAEEQAFSLSVA
jgi:hypothetical protein